MRLSLRKYPDPLSEYCIGPSDLRCAAGHPKVGCETGLSQMRGFCGVTYAKESPDLDDPSVFMDHGFVKLPTVQAKYLSEVTWGRA